MYLDMRTSILRNSVKKFVNMNSIVLKYHCNVFHYTYMPNLDENVLFLHFHRHISLCSLEGRSKEALYSERVVDETWRKPFL